MIRTSAIAGTFFALALLVSCKPSVVLCTKFKPSAAEIAQSQGTVLKYYLPKKVLTFYCPVTIKGKVAYEDDKPMLVGRADVILGDTATIYEDEYQGEGYYIVIKNDKKSLLQTNIGLSLYNNGILKTINAETSNLAMDMVAAVASIATSAAGASCGVFSSVRAETKDTTFKFVIRKEIEFSADKQADTIDFKHYFPKITNKIFFTVSLDKFQNKTNKLDSVSNGFLYYDPQILRTLLTFHSISEKKEITLMERNIIYPQLGEKQVLYLPHSFSDGRILANFNQDGFLVDVSYLKNKDAQSKLQQISTAVSGMISSGIGAAPLYVTH